MTTSGTTGPAPARITPASAARLALPLLGLGALIALVGGSQTWFEAPVDALAVDHVSATGFAAAPGLGPLLLVVAAALVARLLVRGVARSILAGVAALGVLAAAASAVAGLAGAGSTLGARAAELTGVADLAADPTTTAWGWVTILGLALALAGGVLLALQRPTAAARGQRYERRAPARATRSSEPSPVEDWDALTAGEDPSLGDTAAPQRPDGPHDGDHQ